MPISLSTPRLIGWKEAQIALTGSLFDDGASGTEVTYIDASGNVLVWKAGRATALNTLNQLVLNGCYGVRPGSTLSLPDSTIGFGVSSVAAPTGLTASSPNPGEFRIVYTAVSGAVEYTVEYSDDDGATWKGTQKITGVTYTWSGLAADSYLGRVNVRTATGTSDFAQTTTGTSVADTTLFVLPAGALPNARPSARAAIEQAIRNAADSQAFTGADILATIESARLAFHFSSVNPISFLYKDAGTTLAADGEQIYRASSFGNTATNADQTSSSLRPTLFGWGMRTVATKNERLPLNLDHLVGTNYTIFAAAARVQTQNSQYLGGSYTGTTANQNLNLGWPSNTTLWYQPNNSSGISLTVSGYSTPTMEYHGYRLSDTGKTLWRNGSQSGSSSNTSKLVSFAGPAIGRQYNTAENCGVRWFWTFTSALTDSQILQLTRFCQQYDSLTTTPAPVATPIPPAPTGPIATSPAAGTLQADWTLASGGTGEATPTGYKVEYQISGSSSWLGTVTKSSTSTTHQFTSGLTSGSSYRIRVRTVGVNGESSSVTSGYITVL